MTFVGASLGGMVGVAFAVRHPERCGRLITISAGLRPDGWGTATRHLQRELVRDGIRNGDVATGMSRARQLGMLTYRGRDELDTRFGKLAPGLDRPPVAEYLDHHGRRFAERFPVKTFLLLSESIDRGAIRHRSAGAGAPLLERVTADTIVVGVPGDMLFPWALQVELHRELQAAGAQSSLWKLDSAVRPRRVPRRSGTARRTAARRRARSAARRRSAPRPRFDGVGVEPVRELRIGMVGCGTVGRGLLEMIERQHAAVADRYGVRFRVSRIAVRDLAKARGPLAAGIPLTDRPLDLVSDPNVDVVVEVAGGTAMEPILTAALAAGKPVVTANKALLASKLAELGVLAQRTATPLYCEAAAAAALPIIRHLSHRADEIDSLAGILNGTCNFVMTRIEQAELTLDEAVAEAQALGFAEADPSADLDGHDAAAKLSILAYRAFGAWVRPDGFLVRGIRELEPGRLRSRRVDGLPHPADRARGARQRRARHGGRAAAAARLAPAGLGRRGVQRRLPALRLIGRPEPVRQGRGRAADRDRGARRSDRSRAGQLGALAGAAGAAGRDGRHGACCRRAAALPARHRRAASRPRAPDRKPGAARRPRPCRIARARAEADRRALGFMSRRAPTSAIAAVRDAVRGWRASRNACASGCCE